MQECHNAGEPNPDFLRMKQRHYPLHHDPSVSRQCHRGLTRDRLNVKVDADATARGCAEEEEPEPERSNLHERRDDFEGEEGKKTLVEDVVL
ncbi:unnamed protein product [Heligmosomoides polygyrus]|uniref:Uncharacterized protein n=1 Tax=Heligmosomoides polygyrus TaxID=6339 RepID=A0A183GQ90_HELPZ|nr:unnamed protein product [Heligmosomoides polygyrus]